MKPEQIKVGRTYRFLIPGLLNPLIGIPSGICGSDIYVHIKKIYSNGKYSKHEINVWINLKEFAAWAVEEVEDE